MMLESGFILAHTITVVMKVRENDIILPVVLISMTLPLVAKAVGDFLKERMAPLRRTEGSGSERRKGKVKIEFSSGEKTVIDLDQINPEKINKALQLFERLDRE
jgi:hypothetical protein